MRTATLAGATIGAVLVIAGTADAFVFWTNPNGSGTFFNYANGGSANGTFGDPFLVGGNTFFFFPNHYRAEAKDGGSQVTSDTLEVDLIAHPGFKFSMIQISEVGSYSILGGGSVEAKGALKISDNNAFFSTQNAGMTTNPAMPINGAGSGSWNGLASIDLEATGQKWTNIHLVFQNDLIAITFNSGETAYIDKLAIGSGVALTIIPAPGALALLGVAGVLAARRRR